MIIYSITFAIDSKIEEEWILFMKSLYIPSLMNSGFFTQYQHTKIISEANEDLAFNIQLSCSSHEVLHSFVRDEKENLELILQQKYSGKFATFSTTLEKLN